MTRRVLGVVAAVTRRAPGTALDLLDLSVLLPGVHRRPDSAVTAGPVRLRGLLEDLGTTAMKLGQVLSTRPDLVPPAYEAELARLQDAGPLVPGPLIAAAVESALGRPLEHAFASFDRRPLAAASIAQVHAARLADGTEVVVKVRRPGVVEQVEIDLAFLARVAAGFSGDPRIHLPRVIASHSCSSVITEERVLGNKIDDLAALDRAGIDRPAVARLFADAYLTMVFEHGFFHADPHPGNVFVEASDRIGFVDFGMVGRVAPGTMAGLGVVLLALTGSDAERLVEGLLSLGVAGGDIDRRALAEDLGALLDHHVNVPAAEIHIGPLLADVMAVVRAHRLRLPSDLALLLKTVMMCEGVAARLDPGFLLVPLLVPHAGRVLAARDSDPGYSGPPPLPSA